MVALPLMELAPYVTKVIGKPQNGLFIAHTCRRAGCCSTVCYLVGTMPSCVRSAETVRGSSGMLAALIRNSTFLTAHSGYLGATESRL